MQNLLKINTGTYLSSTYSGTENEDESVVSHFKSLQHTDIFGIVCLEVDSEELQKDLIAMKNYRITYQNKFNVSESREVCTKK